MSNTQSVDYTNHNKQLIDWLMTNPDISRLYSLFGEIDGGKKIVTRLSDGTKVAKQYVDGGKMVQTYSDWSILIYEQTANNYQPTNASENLTAYNNAQAIINWINAQRTSKNFPIMSKTVVDVEPIPTNPQIAGVDSQGLVKYIVGVRVTFKGEYIQ